MQFDPAIDITGGNQTRPPGWPAADLESFADALESVLKTGKHDLTSLVDGLNASSVKAPGNTAWTGELLKARLAELDAAGQMTSTH